MNERDKDLATITCVEVLTCPAQGGIRGAESQTAVNVKYETERGPGTVLLTGERSRALDILDAQRHRRWIPVPTP
jgi:hypothetical protein